MLNWRTVTSSYSEDHGKRGTELECAPYGPASRFLISTVRTFIWDKELGMYQPDANFVVRDAHSVTDVQVAAGERSSVVGKFATLDEAIAFCDEQANWSTKM